MYVFEIKMKIAAFFVSQSTDVYNLFVTEFYKTVAINTRLELNNIFSYFFW